MLHVINMFLDLNVKDFINGISDYHNKLLLLHSLEICEHQILSKLSKCVLFFIHYKTQLKPSTFNHIMLIIRVKNINARG